MGYLFQLMALVIINNKQLFTLMCANCWNKYCTEKQFIFQPENIVICLEIVSERAKPTESWKLQLQDTFMKNSKLNCAMK